MKMFLPLYQSSYNCVLCNREHTKKGFGQDPLQLEVPARWKGLLSKEDVRQSNQVPDLSQLSIQIYHSAVSIDRQYHSFTFFLPYYFLTILSYIIITTIINYHINL